MEVELVRIRVASVQFCPESYDLLDNWNKIRRELIYLKEKGVDFVLIPELWWSIGSFRDYIADAFFKTKAVLDEAVEVAKDINSNIILGTLPEKADGRYYNSSYVISREGKLVGVYRKIHVFRYLGEDKYFVGGKDVGFFELDGVKFGIEVCYDIRFFELTRILALRGADVVFVPAAWPDARLYHWKVLNLATAILGQVFVVSSNRYGKAEKLNYPGCSMIIDPWGEVISEGKDREETITGELELSKVEDVRSMITVYRDRVPALYKELVEGDDRYVC